MPSPLSAIVSTTFGVLTINRPDKLGPMFNVWILPNDQGQRAKRETKPNNAFVFSLLVWRRVRGPRGAVQVCKLLLRGGGSGLTP